MIWKATLFPAGILEQSASACNLEAAISFLMTRSRSFQLVAPCFWPAVGKGPPEEQAGIREILYN
jgi:hypothetical protein